MEHCHLQLINTGTFICETAFSFVFLACWFYLFDSTGSKKPRRTMEVTAERTLENP